MKPICPCRAAWRAPRLPSSAGLLLTLWLGGCDDAGSPNSTVMQDAADVRLPADSGQTVMRRLDRGSRPDDAAVDALVADTGPIDASVWDMRSLDAAVPDAAVPDAAVPDAIVADAAPPDAIVADATSDGRSDMMPIDMAFLDAALPDAALPDAVVPIGCPEFDDAIVTGNIADPNIIEASGVVASRRTPGVLWMHNDSGDGNRIFAVGTDGARLGVFELDGARPRDWEDVAVGPGPDPTLTYLYLADVGDNFLARANIRMRRLPEPAVPMGGAPFELDIQGAESFTLVYPDGAHNCETLLVDPRSGDVYLVVKSADGHSPVYRAVAPFEPNAVVPLEHVADLQFGVDPLRGDPFTTGGDISPGGDEIVIRTYDRAYLWRRAPGASIAQALAAPPCPIPQAVERQGEAIGFAVDGSGYYTVSEGRAEALHHYRRR